MLREEKFLLGTGSILAAGAAVAIFTLVAGNDDSQPGNTPTVVQSTPEQDSRLVREQQLSRMIANDHAYVGQQGFRIVDSRPRGQGKCAEDATIFQPGWYDGDTGLLYQVEKGGELFAVCFSHDDEAVTRARAVPLNPPAQPPVVREPQIDQAMLNTLIRNDRNYLGERGYSIVGNYEALGNCEDHGINGVFNDNAGWKGDDTGILYTINDGEGNPYWACVSHDNGRVIDVTAAPK